MSSLDSLLDSFSAMGISAFDCSIYHKGEEIYRRCHGFSDYEKSSLLNGTELFNIYSSSKILTVAAVFQLIEKRQLHLDDRLSMFSPEFENMMVKTSNGPVPCKRQITLWHLLTMTSGLNYDRSEKRPAWVLAAEKTGGRFATVETLKCLACEPLEFEPGSDWLYSFSIDMCTAIIEIVSGKRFSNYCRDNIFIPLGMNDTTFRTEEADEKRIAAQYRYDSQKRKMIPCSKRIQNGFILGPDYESGGAGCVSSVNDMMRFLEALRKGELLSADTVRLISSNTAKGHVLDSFFHAQKDTRYGYGFGVGCPIGKENWNCFGWGGAAGSFAAIDLGAELSIFYVQHVLQRPNMLEKREIYTCACELY